MSELAANPFLMLLAGNSVLSAPSLPNGSIGRLPENTVDFQAELLALGLTVAPAAGPPQREFHNFGAVRENPLPQTPVPVRLLQPGVPAPGAGPPRFTLVSQAPMPRTAAGNILPDGGNSLPPAPAISSREGPPVAGQAGDLAVRPETGQSPGRAYPGPLPVVKNTAPGEIRLPLAADPPPAANAVPIQWPKAFRAQRPPPPVLVADMAVRTRAVRPGRTSGSVSMPESIRKAFAATGRAAPQLPELVDGAYRGQAGPPAVQDVAQLAGSSERLANPVHLKTMPAPTEAGEAWGRQLNERLSLMLRTGINTATVKIEPAHLGPIDIRIAIDDDSASVWFAAQHVLTRDALESSLPRLREAFDALGMDLVRADVSSEHSAGRRRDFEDGGNHGDSVGHIADKESDDSQKAKPNRGLDGQLDTYA